MFSIWHLFSSSRRPLLPTEEQEGIVCYFTSLQSILPKHTVTSTVPGSSLLQGLEARQAASPLCRPQASNVGKWSILSNNPSPFIAASTFSSQHPGSCKPAPEERKLRHYHHHHCSHPEKEQAGHSVCLEGVTPLSPQSTGFSTGSLVPHSEERAKRQREGLLSLSLDTQGLAKVQQQWEDNNLTCSEVI